MPIKAKYNGSYKDITDLMNVDESIDYVLAKTSSSYKRVYTATRSIEDAPPTTFKSIKSGANLTDYRIYGNTSKNILPLSKTPKTETIGDILCEYDGKGTFTFTSNVDNPTYTQDQWFWVPFEEDFDFPVGISDGGHGCIQLNNDFATEYGVTPYFVGFANRDNGEFVSGFNVAGTALNVVDTNYYTEDLEGLPANCIAFQYLQQIGKRTVTIKPALYLDIRTQQPFEPYGESVGDRTANLFDGEFLQGYWAYSDGTRNDTSITWITTSKLPCKPNTDYSFKSSYIGRYFGFVWFESNGEYISSSYVSDTSLNQYVNFSSLSPVDAAYLIINIKSPSNTSSGDSFAITPSNVTDFMLNEGSTALPYEPYGYKVPVTVEGKNLFDYDTITHSYRIQWSSGANYADETAIMSDFISVSENSTYATDTNLYWICYDANKQYIGAWNGSDIVKSGVDAINSMTAISPCKFIRILSFGRKMTPISSATMLNYGSTALPYEPYHAPITTPIYLPEQIKKVGDVAEYIDYGEQKMHKVRKNLFPVDATSKTINGVTFTVNTDNSVTCNGTNNGTSTLIFEFNPSGVSLEIGESYIVTGCPEGGKMSGGYTIQYNNGSSWSYEIGHGATFTVSGSGVVRPRILISRGVTVDNLTFYPMIRKADIEDDTYEPYIENTEVDVTLPALPTVTGTNTLSVGTEVQPSKIDITGHIKTISGGS